jgi:hypothetical protein
MFATMYCHTFLPSSRVNVASVPWAKYCQADYQLQTLLCAPSALVNMMRSRPLT